MASDYNVRSRNWFLCIQKGATCYKHLDMLLDRLDVDTCSWAYIKHDAETYGINGSEIEGKKEHYHVLLVFDNARTFTSITKKFQGAHVEVSHVIADCANYLLHNTEASRKAGKKIYSFDQIVTNNKDALKSWLGARGLRYEVFNENKILEYILVKDCTTLTDFYMHFGASIQRFIPLINGLLAEYNSDFNEPARRYVNRMLNKDDDMNICSYPCADIYNAHSESEVIESSINLQFATFRKAWNLTDFILIQTLYELMDEDCVRVLMNSRKYRDKYDRLGLKEYEGLDWQIIKNYLCEVKCNTLF